MATGDIDDDGDVDVIVAEFFGPLGYYANTGGGTFSTSLSIIASLGFGGKSIQVADLDANLALDVLVADINADTLNLYLQTAPGSTTFASPILLSPPGSLSAPVLFGLGDANGDSLLDALVINSPSVSPSLYSLLILNISISSPPHVFASYNQSSLGFAPPFSGAAMGDVNSDSLGDLVISTRTEFILLLSSSPSNPIVLASHSPPSTAALDPIVLADLDADADADVLTCASTDDIIAFYINLDGKGTFDAPYVVASSVVSVSSLVLGDVSGDGALDVVACGEFSSSVSAFLGTDGGPGFGTVPTTLVSTISDCNSLALGNFAGTRQDVVVSSFLDSTITVYALPPPATTFNTVPSRTISSALPGAQSFVVRDVNHDNYPDVVTPAATGIGFRVFLQTDGGGAFDSGRSFAHASNVFQVLVGDLDRNGAQDVVAISPNSFVASLATGQGRFSPPTTTYTSPNTTYIARMTDVNADGALDVIRAGVAHVFLNLGSVSTPGTFSLLPTPLFSSPNVRYLECIDMDGDGDPDLVLGDATLDHITFRANDGSGGFSSPSTVVVSSVSVQGLAVYDVDADGLVDVAYLTDDVAWVRSLSPGTFAPSPTVLATGLTSLRSLHFQDLNNDGLADYALLEQGNVGVAYGSAPGVYGSLSTFVSGSVTLDAMGIHDVNGDTYNDLVFISGFDETLSWRLNTPTPTVPPLSASSFPTPYLKLEEIASQTRAPCFPAQITLPPNAVITDCSQTDHFVIHSGSRVTLVGDPNGPAVIDCGPQGGVTFDVQGVLFVSNVVFRRMTFGSGIRSSSGIRVTGPDARLVLTNVTVEDSSNVGTGPLLLYAGLGGAVLVDGGRVEADNSVFTANTAGSGGGAIAVVSDGSALQLVASSVTHNTAAAGGGGGILVAAQADITLSGASSLSFNSAQSSHGGALLVRGGVDATIVVTDTVLEGNTAALAGGTLAVQSSVARVTFGNGAVLSGSSATFGGTFASLRTEVDLPTLPASTSILRLPTSLPPLDPPSRAGIVLGPGSMLGDSSAPFGQTAFTCGLTIDATAASVSPSVAAGGSLDTLFCVHPSPPSVEGESILPAGHPWVLPPFPLTQSLSTPPTSFSSEGVPSSVASGVEFGSGSLFLVNGLGDPVSDSAVVVRVASPTPGVSVVNAESGLGLRTGTNVVSTSALAVVGTLAVVNSTGPEGTPGVMLMFACDGPEESAPPTLLVTMSLTACPPGFGATRLSTGSVLECEQCSDGSYSPGFGTSPCVAIPECPSNSVRIEGNGTETSGVPPCVCTFGFWTESGVADTPCVPCPKGGVCVGGSNPPVAAPGFFPSSTRASEFVSCPNPEACSGSGECAEGYTARMCAECEDGYYKLSGDCRKCRPGLNAVIILVLLVGSAIGVGVLLAFSLSPSVNYKFAAAMIGLSGLQIVALFANLKDLDWGEFAEFYFEAASSLNLNFELTSPECSLVAGTDAWVLKLVLTLLLPVFAGVAVALLVCVFAGLGKIGVAWFASKTSGELISGGARTWFQILVLLFLPLTRSAFSIFGCRRDESGRWTLDADPARSCYNAAWWGLFPVGVIAVALYAVAIPVAVVGILYSKRQSMDSIAFTLRFGFLVQRFEEWAWFYQGVILLRGLLVVVCFTFFFTSEGKAAAGVVALSGTLLHLVATRPYAAAFHNGLAMIVLASVIGTLFAGTVDDYTLRRVGVTVGVVINVLAIVLGNGWDVYRITRREKEMENEFYVESVESGGFGASELHSPVETAATMSLATELSDLGVVGGEEQVATVGMPSSGSGSAALQTADLYSVPSSSAPQRPPRKGPIRPVRRDDPPAIDSLVFGAEGVETISPLRNGA